MSQAEEHAVAAAAFLRDRLHVSPKLLLVLGSGLGPLGDDVEDACAFPFDAIPGFPPSTVEGHHGRLVAGMLEGVACLVLQGRSHHYEGHPAERLALPVRTAAELGVETLIVTNAAGGLDPRFRIGDLMVITDHINLMGSNPLIGRMLPGEQRFPDMSAPYHPGLRRLAEGVALASGIACVQGVYCALSGPSYETRAEITMLRRLGADAVGMSTVPEVLAARARGMRVLGVSLITNLLPSRSPAPLVHEEVIEAGVRARDQFARLIRGVVRELSEIIA